MVVICRFVQGTLVLGFHSGIVVKLNSANLHISPPSWPCGFLQQTWQCPNY